jgi:hypothetical protein
MNDKIKYQRLTDHPKDLKPEDAFFNELSKKGEKNEKVWCMKTDRYEKYLFVVTGHVLPRFEKSARMLYVLQFDDKAQKPKPCFKVLASNELK